MSETKVKIRQVEDLEEVLDSKQETLVSGVSIKTINGETLLGSGNLTLEGFSIGETNTASNLGSGFGIFAQKEDVDLRFKSIKAGSNTSINIRLNGVNREVALV